MNTCTTMSQTPHIRRVETLGYVNDDVAQSYMEHITQRIISILPRRGWYIGTLKEFYPRKTSLLGLNIQRGVEICIRLRVPGNKQTFLPFHEVVCTVLHELAHCQEDKHTMPFWNLYYELLRECEAVEVKMISQGMVLYPERIICSSEDIITKRVGNKLQKRGKTGSGGRKLDANQSSTTVTNNNTSLLDSSSKIQPFCGVGYRLGGLKSPAEEKPNSGFLAAVMESRLQMHSTYFSSLENVEVKYNLESSSSGNSIFICDRCGLHFKLYEGLDQGIPKRCKTCAKDTMVSIGESKDSFNIYEGQDTRILKHCRLEQIKDKNVYAVNEVRESVVGSRASCAITID